MTTTITTRVGKGGRLSFTEMDANFTNLQSTADSAAPQSTTYTKTQVDTALATKQATIGFTPVNANTIGAASGLATLDATGKLTTAQIPTSLVGAVVYQGVWNASTNVPALVSGIGTKGYYYKVSATGATAIDGISQWNIGDVIIFNGTTWDKIDGVASEVVTVAGRTGSVVLTTSDVSESANLYFTTARASAAAPVQSVAGRAGAVVLAVADVSGAAPLASPAFTGTVSGSFSGNGSALTSLTGANVTGTVPLATSAVTISGTYAGALTSLQVTTGLGFTPYNATNPSLYITSAGAPVQTVFGRTGAVVLTSADVTTALTYTPVNPATAVTSVAGRTGVVVLTQADISGLTVAASPTFAAVTATTFTGALAGNAATASKLLAAQSIALSGDATGTASFDGSTGITLATTLAVSGVVPGAGYNMFTVDAKGRVTLASTVSYLTANQSISITGDATGSGTTGIALVLASSGVTAGSYSKVTVDAKGRVTFGAAIASSDVTTALGFTPSNQATTYTKTEVDAAIAAAITAFAATLYV